jgi:hypothetical protein
MVLSPDVGVGVVGAMEMSLMKLQEESMEPDESNLMIQRLPNPAPEALFIPAAI